MIHAGQPTIDPAPYVIGNYNGSTAIPVAPRWLSTAKHVGDSDVVDVPALGEESSCKVLRRVKHPSLEFCLLLVDRDMPVWYPPRRTLLTDPAPAKMLGFGRTGSVGGPWGFPRLPLVGESTLRPMGQWALSVLENDGNPNRAAFVENDSGGGWLVDGELVAVAVSITAARWGTTTFGDVSYGQQLGGEIAWFDSVLADADGNGAANYDDIPFYISQWFRSGRLAVSRIFEFLTSWFSANRSST